MRTWIRCRITGMVCGSCTAAIPKGSPLLELTIAETNTKRARCPACAKTMFGDDVPTDIPDDSLTVPQPSLHMETIRRPDFVTPRAYARAMRRDVRQRQTGERE